MVVVWCAEVVVNFDEKEKQGIFFISFLDVDVRFILL